MDVRFSTGGGDGIAVTLAFSDRGLPETLKAAAEARGFTGKADETVDLVVADGAVARRALLIGGGPQADFTPVAATAAGRHLSAIAGLGGQALDVRGVPDAVVAAFAFGVLDGAYRDDRYKTAPPTPLAPAALTMIVDAPDACTADFAAMPALAEGIAAARDLANAPPNRMTPPLFADWCRALAIPGLDVEVLDAEALAALGMGALIGVGQGSAAPPCVVVLRWSARGGEAPLAFIGKGVTFDSGGLLPKPAEEMWDMKYDRAGAAAVVGAMIALARRNAAVDAVGIIGLAENMPSGAAQRPGDVVVSHSGQTIEVLHTDAEGRLLLCDLLSYARARFKPSALIDIATLTGGLTSVLTDQYAGLYANDDALAASLTETGEACGERLWRLPLGEAFDRMIDSSVADMQNICKVRWGGTVTAAQFLKRFVGDTPWAHLDIFGPAWNHGAKGRHGATGYGVRLLAALAERQAAQ